MACLLGLGTGGAYYLATAADVIIADATTITGAVGVILNLYNLREMMGQINVIAQPIKAGSKIDLGTPLRNLVPEDRRLLETMAEELHQHMVRQILQARPGIDQAEGTTWDGRVFTASQALERKLIDRIGYPDEAIDLARQLARCPEAAVAMYHRANDPARLLLRPDAEFPAPGQRRFAQCAGT